MKKSYRKMIERSQKAKRTPILHVDHPIPVTRRDMLRSGLISMTGAIAMPSILSLVFSSRAYALECAAADVGADFIPYLHMELSGGASLAGNFMFGKQRDGGPFEALAAAGYGTLGLPPELAPGTLAMDMSFGGPMHPASGLLAGLNSVMSPEAIAKSVVAGGAGTSNDDTANNPLNGIQLALGGTGASGALVQIVGTEGSNTGGRTRELDVGADPSLTKARVGRARDVLDLVDPGLIAERLSTADATRIADAVRKMSGAKLAMFNQKDLPSQIKDLVECGYLGSSDLLTKFDADSVNPANDPLVTGLIDMNDNDEQRVGSIAKMLLDGYAAGGTIQKGGYDYHGRGRVEQDARDFAAGREIGIALELAHQKGRAMFVAVTSDGSVSARANSTPNDNAGGKYDFRSDSGSRGSYLMFAIGAAARPEMNSTQIGAFNDSGAVDTSYLATSSSPRLQAMNIAANYAALNGKMGKFTAALTKAGVQNPFDGQDRQYLAFTPVED